MVVSVETCPAGDIVRSMWHGDYLFLLRNPILKDSQILYRSTLPGVFRSLLRPLVMVGVFISVFTQVTVPIHHSFEIIPQRFTESDELNPVATFVMALHDVL